MCPHRLNVVFQKKLNNITRMITFKISHILPFLYTLNSAIKAYEKGSPPFEWGTNLAYAIKLELSEPQQRHHATRPHRTERQQ
jgi:hypothetical protein